MTPRPAGLLVALAVAGGMPVTCPAAPASDDSSLLAPRAGAQLAAGTGSGEASTSVLERALRVETRPGQRNLDLLLETRGGSPSAVDPLARRRSGTVLSQASDAVRPADAASQGQMQSDASRRSLPRSDLVALAAEAGLSAGVGRGENGQGRDGAPARREWLGAVGDPLASTQRERHTGTVVLADQPDAGGPGDSDARGEGHLRRDLQALQDFVREYRFWLIGGVFLALVAQLGLQVLFRLLRAPSGQPMDPESPSTQRDNVAAPVMPRHRRRSSRRQ